MGIQSGACVAGEVFAAAHHAGRAQAAIEGAGKRDDLCGTASIASAAERVVGLVVEGNVEHRAQIEIESEESEQASGDEAVLRNEGRIALVPELLCVGRFVSDEPEPRNAPPFLVDRDDWLDRAGIAQIVDQFSELGGRFDIAAEQNKSPGLESADQGGKFGIESFARNSKQQGLAGMMGLHNGPESNHISQRLSKSNSCGKT